MWVGELAADVLKRHDTKHLFGLIGGHVQGVIDWACMRGIQFIQTRHEQSAGYAADAYARLTKQPAVMAVTAGPGFLNAASALRHCQLVRSPVICIVGGHPLSEDERRTVQELDTVAAARPLGKRVMRCLTKDSVPRMLTEAFLVARSYPPGVVVVELPSDLDDLQDPPGFPTSDPLPVVRGSTPDAHEVERVLQMLVSSERPLLVAGEGLYWSGNSDDIRGLCGSISVPASLRRLARGMLAETHPLAVNAGIRGRAIADADLVLLLGLEASWLEHFAEWKTSARFVQISEDPSEFVPTLPTELAIAASPGGMVSALNQAIAGAGDAILEAGRTRKASWLTHLDKITASFLMKQRAMVESQSSTSRMHPGVLMRAIGSAMPEDTRLILDSFTCSLYGTDVIKAVSPAQILDAGRHAGLGHSVGMAIGAKLAAPDAPVVSILGDGAVGIAGMDVETAARYQVPAIFVISNNSSLAPGLEKYAYGDGWPILGPNNTVGYNTLPDIRYDRMFAHLGCHTEFVEIDEQLVPAMQRALDSGRPAVVNVLTEKDIIPEIYSSPFAGMAFRHLPPDAMSQQCLDDHFPNPAQTTH